MTVQTTQPAKIDLSHHERRCSICRHPERDAIEQAFIHWTSTFDISEEFNLPGSSAVYRHAHATGLHEFRRQNVRYALDQIINNAAHVDVTADSVVRAVRAYARINSSGQWVEPAKRIVISVIHRRAGDVTIPSDSAHREVVGTSPAGAGDPNFPPGSPLLPAAVDAHSENLIGNQTQTKHEPAR